MTKVKWKNIVKQSITNKSLKYLESIKQKHSKVKEVKHKKLEIQPYLLPSETEMIQEEINTIFRLRCRETKVKMNLKSWYDTYECTVCLDEDESQEHVYKCTEILKLGKCERATSRC